MVKVASELEKELERINLSEHITQLMGEIQKKMFDLRMCLFIFDEISKDWKMEVSVDVRSKNGEGKSLAKNTKKVSPETS